MVRVHVSTSPTVAFEPSQALANLNKPKQDKPERRAPSFEAGGDHHSLQEDDARPGEKVLYVLRTKGAASVETLALAVYGHTTHGNSRKSKNVAQNTRKLLEKMRRDELVERDSLGIWRLSSAPG